MNSTFECPVIEAPCPKAQELIDNPRSGLTAEAAGQLCLSWQGRHSAHGTTQLECGVANWGIPQPGGEQ